MNLFKLFQFVGKYVPMKRLVFLLIGFAMTVSGISQHLPTRWQDVSQMNVEGQAWEMEDTPFHRFPLKAKEILRPEVWNLSRNASGLWVGFFSDSPEIEIRYQVTESLDYSHMPATGKSGIDLYAVDKKGEKHWLRGKYSFKDTITYKFQGISYKDYGTREYQLYLPLYNSLKWMQIGVAKNSRFKGKKKLSARPIVIYGTSIAQGACATRPGMSWSNILGRKLNMPIINFGFSGNGRLEKEVLSLINEIDASLFVLDCMPNFYLSKGDTPKMVKERLYASIDQIREKHPETPIVLVQHAGYSDGVFQTERKEVYEQLNTILENVFGARKKSGVKALYMLSFDEIGLIDDSFVDGTHPNDLGMVQYATAYEKKIRQILK